MDKYNQTGEITDADIASCEYIINVNYLQAKASSSDLQSFFDGGGYVIRPIYEENGLFGYIKFTIVDKDDGRSSFLLWQNSIFAVILVTVIFILIYIRVEIVHPMNVFKSLPAALSRGDFTTPVKVHKGRFFGQFMWGLDMLRETMLSERQKSLALEKEKSQTVLALSHDIKTPLGAIVLCSKALREGLYPEKEKQNELLIKIDERALEIQSLVQALQEGASEEMLDLPVENGEFYLDEIIRRTEEAYRWRMDLTGTDFAIEQHSNSLLKGDSERAFEALCNLLENAMKYGDGKQISICFSREEGCQLITVVNSGSTLQHEELVHLFDSFWRGSNAKGKVGNGLGLFIARRLCVKMGGEAFAAMDDNEIKITLVFKTV